MAPTGNDEDVLLRMEAKLEQMLRLAALQATAGMKQVQAIQTLTDAGVERRVIADLLHTTPNTVSVTFAKAKAKKSAKPRESEPAEQPVTPATTD
jgi:hypothetical protein